MLTKKIILSLFASLALISCGGSATKTADIDPITIDDKQLTFDTSVKGEFSGDLAITGAILKGTPSTNENKYVQYSLMVEVTKKGSGWKDGKFADNVEFYYVTADADVCDAQGLPLDISVIARPNESSFPRKVGEKVWIPCEIGFYQENVEAMNKIIATIAKVDLSVEIRLDDE